MQKIDEQFRFSASDLVGHLDCHHLTALDAAVARGSATKPKIWDPVLETLAERGRAHEREYLEKLKESGLSIVEIEGGGINSIQVAQTLEAMQSGAEVIYQGALLQGVWSGRADILRRLEVASDLGAWSYEVIDTKLARETKGATVLQLSLYSELLAVMQGLVPEHMYVVTPGSGFEPEIYRTQSFGAYYRRVKGGLEQFLDGGGSQSTTYPEPNSHCELCAWRVPCDQRRRADDHLCLVAGITKIQMNELRGREVSTLTSLAHLPLPLAWKPERGSVASYERTREQARIQVEGRVAGKPVYETLAVVKDLGLSAMPASSPGDVFFDLEGDPFIKDGGLEYLFGYAFEDGGLQYRGDWAVSREEEKQSFEAFVDFVMARWAQYPNFHINHYAPYEPSALKRLMGRYASREEEIDRMLRGGLFVDLYQIVRHAVRASVESYSIKELERFFGFDRSTKLTDASRALANIQTALELGDPEAVTQELKDTVTGYNKDDCFSAKALRDWLEMIRANLITKGTQIERPLAPDLAISEELTAWQKRVEELVGRLTPDIPVAGAMRIAPHLAGGVLPPKVTETSQSYGSPTRGITQADVSQAADALLRAGERPTVDKIRSSVGRGSPNTVGPLLDTWWKRLAGRLDAGPAAFHRLPESVAHVAEALWMQALEEGRYRALIEQRMADRARAHDKERLDLRSHVLTLREGEMEARLQDRDRTIAELESRIQMLTGLLQKEQASRDSVTRRLLEIEPELLAAHLSIPKDATVGAELRKPITNAAQRTKRPFAKLKPGRSPNKGKQKTPRRRLRPGH